MLIAVTTIWVPPLYLFSSQLLVQFGHVVVPLGLVTGSRLRCSQVVLLPEGLDVELAAAVAGAVGKHGLGARQGPWLLVDQPHVPVEAWGERKVCEVCWEVCWLFMHRKASF